MLHKKLIAAGLSLCVTLLIVISTALVAASVATSKPRAQGAVAVHTEMLASRRTAVNIP